MKHLKIGLYELYAGVIIVFATGLRVTLAALGWPPTNSDEGTMGIMALHIHNRGEHPPLFYGQSYMGTIEAHLGAMFLHIFGPSLFSLRLGLILMTMLFLISTYLLTSLLYSKKLALVTLILLSFGSIQVFEREMIATGGSTQTLLFGSLAFLLAAWLGYTHRPATSARTKLWQFAGYSCWGLVIGLGFWSDMVVLPFLAGATLLLLVFCWRDMLWASIGVLGGFCLGALPIIQYTLDSHQSALAILLGLFRGSTTPAPHTLYEILNGIRNTVLVSVPTATGNPFCPVMEPTFLGDNSPNTPLCTFAHASWAIAYFALLALTLFLTLRVHWHTWSQAKFNMRNIENRQGLVRQFARLALLASGILAITVYSVSSGPTGWPGYHARYIVGLLIVTPALLAPLWSAASTIKFPQTRREHIKIISSRGVLTLIGVVYLIGTMMLFSEVPATQVANQSQARLINHLVQIGATHIYTDYWSCNTLAFDSNERIICGVTDGHLQPSHNREPHYYSLVHADPHAAYVFPQDSSQAAWIASHTPYKYQHTLFDGYVIYQWRSL